MAAQDDLAERRIGQDFVLARVPGWRMELADVHGFHSYPARMHPQTAQRLIASLSENGDVVLDPFCGSGTVLVEAHRLGRRGRGYDINPISRELTWLKALGPDAA